MLEEALCLSECMSIQNDSTVTGRKGKYTTLVWICVSRRSSSSHQPRSSALTFSFELIREWFIARPWSRFFLIFSLLVPSIETPLKGQHNRRSSICRDPSIVQNGAKRPSANTNGMRSLVAEITPTLNSRQQWWSPPRGALLIPEPPATQSNFGPSHNWQYTTCATKYRTNYNICYPIANLLPNKEE